MSSGAIEHPLTDALSELAELSESSPTRRTLRVAGFVCAWCQLPAHDAAALAERAAPSTAAARDAPLDQADNYGICPSCLRAKLHRLLSDAYESETVHPRGVLEYLRSASGPKRRGRWSFGD